MRAIEGCMRHGIRYMAGVAVGGEGAERADGPPLVVCLVYLALSRRELPDRQLAVLSVSNVQFPIFALHALAYSLGSMRSLPRAHGLGAWGPVLVPRQGIRYGPGSYAQLAT
jgi:hypothetical protein